ncbi:hypothetical protein [Paracoccus mutanolyticus]|uniref:hypothetical protein n=1 Tax=Paracoccus mutanolyticus TaxID=1499308 RepID=UPI001CB925C5|nr:hypothetical protein [Paracoccus mutanolyticus]
MCRSERRSCDGSPPARASTGAGIGGCRGDVTLPMVLPALIFDAALHLLLGCESFDT